MTLTRVALTLRRQVEALAFAAPVTHVYNPLRYAWVTHRQYLERYGAAKGQVLLVGMNPGPWGMAQTGVPFGDVTMVRDWLAIDGKIARPEHEHPKRPVQGFDCPRSEVSGSRLWGWARTRFGEPQRFFARFMVWNYCPLSFMEASGRNRTPDKLPRAERDALFTVCDRALERAVVAIEPSQVVGIGRFAADRCASVIDDRPVAVAPHPSPASPAANRGWEAIFERALTDAGIAIAARAAR